MSLLSNEFKNDPRYLKAKQMMMQTFLEYQDKLIKIKPPLSEYKQLYETTLREFENARGVNLWHPYLGSGFGKGALVELSDGSVKLDFISGVGVHFCHGNTAIIKASLEAAFENIVMQGNLQQNKIASTLAKTLLENSCFDHIFFSTSGAMACENALKIIFQKKFPAKRILAFEHCFMGRTLQLAQITDKPEFRVGLPSNVLVDYLPFYDGKQPQASTQNALSIMKSYLERYPGEHAALCAELIQGEGGVNVGNRDFFVPLFELAKKHKLAVFVDEVQTFGRTHELFAYQHFQLDTYVDVVTIGKLSQVAATLYKHEFKPLPGLLSQTFIGSSAALYTSKVIIDSLLNDGYYGKKGKIALLHQYFTKQLKRLQKKHPQLIEGPFGLGGFISFTPFQGVKSKVEAFAHSLFERGLIVFISGTNPTRIRMLPPIGGICKADIDNAFTIIEEALVAL